MSKDEQLIESVFSYWRAFSVYKLAEIAKSEDVIEFCERISTNLAHVNVPAAYS
jgi:hypothetical protein